VAGSVFATSILKGYLRKTAKGLKLSFPNLRLGIYVDDIQLLFIGKKNGLSATMTRALRLLLPGLEDILHFLVHSIKSVVAASLVEIAEDIINDLGRLTVATTVKHLGVDFAPRQRTTKAASAALKKAAARVPRLKAIRAGGGEAWKIGRTGLAPAINYGLSVNGRSDSQLSKARQVIGASAFTSTSGKSLTMCYLLHPAKDLDPAFAAHRGPLLAWARAIWTKSVPLGQLSTALRKAQEKQASTSNPWGTVHGLAGAVSATLRRLGWEAKTANLWTTDTGQEIDLALSTGPRTLRKLVDEAVYRWQCKQPDSNPALALANSGAGPAVRGTKKVLADLWKSGETAQAAALRSTVIGAQWPEARLHEAGLSDTDKCQRCMTGVGNLLHRHIHCKEILQETPYLRGSRSSPTEPVARRASRSSSSPAGSSPTPA